MENRSTFTWLFGANIYLLYGLSTVYTTPLSLIKNSFRSGWISLSRFGGCMRHFYSDYETISVPLMRTWCEIHIAFVGWVFVHIFPKHTKQSLLVTKNVCHMPGLKNSNSKYLWHTCVQEMDMCHNKVKGKDSVYSALRLQKHCFLRQEVTLLSLWMLSASPHLHSSPSLLHLSLPLSFSSPLSLSLALRMSVSLSTNTKSLPSHRTAGVCCLFLSAYE